MYLLKLDYTKKKKEKNGQILVFFSSGSQDISVTKLGVKKTVCVDI